MIRYATVQEITRRVNEVDVSSLVLPGFDAENTEAITDGWNLVIVEKYADSVIEIHWLLRDKGRVAITTGIDFLRYLFQKEGARVVIGTTPAHKRAARWFSRQVGGKSSGIIQTEFGEQELFAMTREDFEAQHGISEI